MEQLGFRNTTVEDSGKILHFIKELAKYEKMEEEVVANISLIEDEIFSKKRANVFFITLNDVEIGFCVYFYNYSTFQGRAGLYVEDLFILPTYRHKGYGRKTFKAIARIANLNNCKRIEWCCLNWNEPSIDFYHSLSAKGMKEWTTFRLNEDNIKKLID